MIAAEHEAAVNTSVPEARYCVLAPQTREKKPVQMQNSN